MSAEFVGAGWAFPLRTDATGRVALVRAEREIEESIRLILGTTPGERPMRPEFGCRISDHIFAPADATTAGRIIADVRLALDRWEPRIDLLDVLVHFDEVDNGALYIDLHYTIRGSNDPRNLVFPFYLIPEHLELTDLVLDPTQDAARDAARSTGLGPGPTEAAQLRGGV